MKNSGNKGEWSEIYVLLKLLSQSKLFSASEQLTPTESYVNVKSIFRKDTDLTSKLEKDFEYIGSDSMINIIDSSTGNILYSIQKKELTELSENLFKEIQKGTGRSFSVNKIVQEKLYKLYINRIKQPSNSKGDINLLIHDPNAGLNSLQKFSIKSLIGSNPTLFNSNKTTNIIYEIKDNYGNSLNQKLIDEVNNISNPQKYIRRINFLEKKGFNLFFQDYENETFKLNLQLIDSNLPEIIAFIVKEKFSKKITKMTNVIQNLNKINPLNYNLNLGHNFYEYRIVNFLVEVALGMTSKAVWTGVYDAIGGIIIVKDDSDVLCYHLIDFNKFRVYLKTSTKLDNPSGSRHGYGVVYEENRKTYIKLNFQIRS